VIGARTSLDEAAKCALISMDSTIRSNLSVGLPLDLVIYENDTLKVGRHINITQDSAYYGQIRKQWGEQLRQGFAALPAPDWNAL